MKLGRKLIALVTVFLMVFGGLPMTTALAVSYDFDYDGLGDGEEICTGRSWFIAWWNYHYTDANIINLKDESDNNKKYKTFCINMNKSVSTSMNYGRNDSYDVPNANYVRGIIVANAASSGIANLDNDEIAAAKQAAIWHYTDGFDLPDYKNKSEVYNLYQWLLSQTRGEDATAVITVSFNRLLEYKDNFSKADLEFRYKVTGGTVSDLTCAAIAGVTFEFVDPASDGDSEWNYIRAKNAPVSSNFTLTVSGNQEKQVFYKYVSTGGSGFQSLAGLPVAAITTVSSSAAVNFGGITVTKNVGTETVRSGDSFIFKLYQGASASGMPFRSKTINSATSFTFGGLPYGQYTLTEESVGSFNGTPVYEGNISGQLVTVGGTVQNVTVKNSRLHGDIHITKSVGSETVRTGDSFTFNLYAGTSKSGPVVKTHTRTTAGSFDFTGLEYGQYYLEEISTGSFNGAPVYDGNISGQIITVGGTVQNVTVTNSRLKGDIHITKSIGSETAREGDRFTFNLYAGTSKSGPVVKTHTLTTAGSFDFTGLEYGAYYLEEVIAGGFNGAPQFSRDINPTTHVITVDGPDKYVTVTNTKLKGDIRITKNVGAETMRTGDRFTFNLYWGTSATGEPVKTKIINPGDSLSFNFTGLEYGQYFLEEVKTGSFNGTPQYRDDIVGQVVTVSGTVQNVTVTNSRLKGDIHITKSLGSETAREGDRFTFNLYAGTTKSGTPVRTDILTGAGSVDFTGLEYGPYYLEEISTGSFNGTPAYDGNIIGQVVTVGGTVQNVTVTNSRLYGGIHVTKALSSEVMRSGDSFTFNLYAGTSASGSPVQTHTINFGDALEFDFTDLEYGQYYLDEVITGSFNGTPAYSARVITVGGTVQNVTVTNSRLHGKIAVTKALAGSITDTTAKFVFTLSQGSTVVATSPEINAGDSYTFENLEFGEYRIAETPSYGFAASPSFSGDIKLLTTDVIVVDSTGTKAVTCTNTKLFGSVKVIKNVTREAGDSAAIPTFKVEVVGPTGNPNAASKTQSYIISAGNNTISGLEYGNYTIRELTAAPDMPQGYAFESINTGTFTVDGSAVDEITITNIKQYGAIEVTKTIKDSASPLPGTQFQFKLMDGDTQVGAVQTLVWNASGDNKVVFAKPGYLLDIGRTYKVVELDNAFGYDVDAAYKAGVDVPVNSTELIKINCTNTKLYGKLTVTKALAGSIADTTAKFVFTLSQGSTVVATSPEINAGDSYTFDNLEFGEYRIAEVPSYGFAANPSFSGDIKLLTADIIVVDSTGTKAVTCTNTKLFGSVKVIKTVTREAGDSAAIPTFKVEVVGPTGNPNAASKTQSYIISAGNNTISGLEYGNYTIRELTAAPDMPQGYALESINTGTFTVDGSAADEITITNIKQYGAIEVTKTIKDSASPLPGTQFQFKLMDGDTQVGAVQTLVWNAGGDNKVTFAKPGYLLEIGHTYKVVELDNAFGYDVDAAYKAGVAVPVNSTELVKINCTNTKLFGKLTVSKASFDSADTYASAKFMFLLTPKSGGAALRSPAIAAGTSFTFENLEFGEYVISELPSLGFAGTPQFTGNLKAGTTDTVLIDTTATKTVTCTNTKLFGGVNILKVLNRDSKDSTAIPDFQVDITGPAGNPNAVSKTQRYTIHVGDNAITGLEYGNYTIAEVGQTGYRTVSISNESKFFVDGDNTNDVTVTVTNEKLYGSIEVTKAFAADTVKAPDGTVFTFRLIDTATGLKVGIDKLLTWTATGNNKVTFAAPDYLLQYGQEYKVVELPATGYEIDPLFKDGYKVTINREIHDYKLTCTNTRLGTIAVTKQMAGDYVGEPIFEFTITGPSFAVPEKFTLTPGATKQFTSLINGEYTVVEALADGFMLKDITGTGMVDADNAQTYLLSLSNAYIETIDHTATFTNGQLGKLQVIKKDADNPALYLGGAVFKVTSVADPTITFNLTTSSAADDTLGKAISTWLEPGDYLVQEITAPAGYHIDDGTENTLAVTAGGTATLTFTDSLGSVLVHKTSSYGSKPALAGVTFQLLKSKPAADGSVPAGDIVGTATTGANGMAAFNALLIGNTYYVREVQQAANYDIDKSLVIAVKAEYKPEKAAAEFENNPLGTVQVTKTDKADATKKLAGAVFGIYSDAACTKLVQTLAATDANGVAKSGALPFGGSNPGTYYVKEITAPAGYVLSATVSSATFTEAGQVVALDFGNTLNVGSIVINKIDASGDKKPLQGATFVLYSDAAGTVKAGDPVTTGADGVAKFNNLAPGTYYFEETVAPTDYVLPETRTLYDAVVTAGSTTLFEIQNQYNPPLDISTGMMDWNILLIGGLALLAGLLLVVFNRRRRMHPNVR